MAATADRIVAVNLEPEELDSLAVLRDEQGAQLITIDSEADLLANLMEGSAVVVLGLQGRGLSPLSVLRALSLARTRPAIVLIGEVDERLYHSIQRLGSRLRLDSMAHVARGADGAQMVASLLRAARATAAPEEAELRRALEEHELTLHYQPKFACADDRSIVSVEALVRWNHPELGLLRPGRFLPLAEQSGLLTDVTDFTIAEAIRQHGAWRDKGHDVPVAINLSTGLIRDDGFPDRLMTLFRQHGVSPSRFTLEVKETASTADRDLCADVFTRLRLAGVGLALDDYGVGLSSLTELYKLPFTELKIDRALVADAPNNGDARVVMHGIVRLAHELAINVCAESVETRAELNAVLAAGCDFVQGTLLCDPERPDELERSLADSRRRYVATQPLKRAQRDGSVAV